MVEINYRGGNAVAISTKKTKLVIDPVRSIFGQKNVTTNGVIELATEERLAARNDDSLLSIEGPGEYEIADFAIRGVAARRHIDDETQPLNATMYRIEVDGIRVAVIGNVAKDIDETQFEAIGVVDILIIPVGGGGYTLDPTDAATIARSIDAKTVIPVHYADSQLSYEVPQEELSVFEKELGCEVERVDELKIKSPASLPQVLTIVAVARS